MRQFDSLGQVLEAARGQQREIRFIDAEDDESTLSFAALWEQATELLGALQARGMQPGDELVIFTGSNRKFVVAFWAAVLGGIVPVPVAVGGSEEHRYKLLRILGQMRRGTLYTEANMLQRLQDFAAGKDLREMLLRLEKSTVLDDAAAPAQPGSLVARAAGDIAFVQYSSGSTSEPKGVCLTHRNLCTNVGAIVAGLGFNDRERSLSWMPLTHDMGLIGFHLSTLAAGMDHAVMDTGVFVRRPLLWMSKANELRATQLCSPNFGYKHFLKLFQRKGLPDLDLSCVKRILNGAEPISHELCEEFLDALAPHGLRRTAMLPVYGLAEATVAVTKPALDREYARIVADRQRLRIGEPYVELDPRHPDAISFIKVGHAVQEVEIRIVDDADQALAEGLVGHIQARGGSITAGLYGDDDGAAAADLFSADGWLRTGDVGVIDAGELVVTGRSKDLIIVNGQNYYPHDLEEIVTRAADFDLGKVVVCAVRPPGSQLEELIVFLLYRRDLDAFAGIAAEVRAAIGAHAGLEVDHVLPVTRIPKTTSGKVQRARLAQAYVAGEFAEAAAHLAAANRVVHAPEADPLVNELVAICREFSRDRPIGPDDNLFETGVSSLTLTEIMLAVDEKYPGAADIADLFDYPTIRELADFMQRSKENG
ncbi:MAG: mutanobactin A non-ribosomal peptide synthetase MubE [Gammaproteobacteria bacterium]|nr:MAG: mutanobactin A non-ribosomal peptide synthetase MubE [Gammaproteobacteria bacterium]